MNYFKLLFCTLLTFSSASFAMDDMHLKQLQTHDEMGTALTTIRTHANLTERETVHGLLNPKQCHIRAGLLDVQLKQLHDKNMVNECDSNGNTLLMKEITQDCDPEIADVLLENDADPCIQNKQGETALHLLLDRQNLQNSYWYVDNEKENKSLRVLIRLLAHAKVKHFINCMDKKGDTPLLRGLQNVCSEQVINRLIDAGADIYQKALGGSSVIHIIGAKYPMGKRQRLIDRFIALDKKNNNPVPLLDQPNDFGQTPLMEAAWKNRDDRSQYTRSSDYEALIELLLAHKPNIHVVDKNGATVLDALIHHFNKNRDLPPLNEIIDRLLALDTQKSLVNRANSKGNTPLMLSHTEALTTKLINHDADITAKNHNGETFINYLVKHVPVVHVSDDWRHWYLKGCNIRDIIQAIPENQRARILNEPDNDGNTPVMNCIKRNEVGAHQHLGWWSGSGEPHYETKEWKTDYSATLDSLLKHGANPNTRNALGQPVLEVAYNRMYNLILDNCVPPIANLAWVLYRRKENNFMNILWKYNPENKWKIYRKCNPYTFYGALAAGASAIGAAGYLGWKLASGYIADSAPRN